MAGSHSRRFLWGKGEGVFDVTEALQLCKRGLRALTARLQH